MPKIRLNKAVKELNISIPRAVEYLQSKGIGVDSNPNALLEEQAFSALEAEFRKDGEQRKASHEVVISKVPDEKLAIEEKAPEVIRAKANVKPETRILGKIDLNPTKSVEEVVPNVPTAEPVQKEEPKPEVVKREEKQEFKVLDKIDLSKLESNKPKTSEKPKEQPKPVVKEEVKKEEKVVEAVKPQTESTESNDSEEPQKIETVYQKLDGPKIVGEKIDLSQFNKPKPSANSNNNAAKKKRKRITKDVPGQNNNGNQGNNQQGGNNQGGGNRQGGNNNNRPQKY